MPHPAGDAAFCEMMAFVPVDEAARRSLWARMTESGRHYHDAGHLADLWRLHRRLGPAAGFGSGRSAVLLASAIAYHDAVCVAGRTDNEAQSAALWMRASGAGSMEPEDRAWVADTIRASADHLAAGDACEDDEAGRLRQWFLDLDLASLGEDRRVFDANTAKLRREASVIGDEAWARGLHRFMTRLDASAAIYRSPALHALFEEPARRNIRACLQALTPVSVASS